MKNRIVFEGEFIFIVKTIKPANRITDIYHVASYSNKSGRLAVIKWFSSWREFVLFPDPGTAWSSGCLSEIETFLETIMVEYKIERVRRRNAN